MDIISASFSGHESFPFRHTWLTKGVTACERNPAIFRNEGAMVELGVGKNMVQSIRHWCLAAGLVEEDSARKNNRGNFLRPTELGRRLFIGENAWDRYLEDAGTLWLVHWLLTTNQNRATTWCFAFNYFHQPDFSRRALLRSIESLASRIPSVRYSESTIQRDIDVFIRTYVGSHAVASAATEDTLECPLSELGLIYEQEQGDLYAFMRGPKDSLPQAVLLYALQEYADRHPNQRSFTFDEIAYSPLSPGRVFKLDESSLAERLEVIFAATGGAWQYSETAGYKQVAMARRIDSILELDLYYNGRRKPAGEVAA